MIPPQSSCQSKQQRAVPIYENTRRRARSREQQPHLLVLGVELLGYGRLLVHGCAPESPDTIRPRGSPDWEIGPGFGVGVRISGSSCSLFLSPSPPCVFALPRRKGRGERKGEGRDLCRASVLFAAWPSRLLPLSLVATPWIFLNFIYLFFSWFVYGGRLVYLCGLTMSVVWGFAGLTTIKPRIFLVTLAPAKGRIDWNMNSSKFHQMLFSKHRSIMARDERKGMSLSNLPNDTLAMHDEIL